MRFAGVFVFLGVMALGCSVANAGPSANRIKQGPGLLDRILGDDGDDSAAKTQSAMEEEKNGGMTIAKAGDFDGVWRNKAGRLLLVKRIHRTLYLSGSSNDAAWQAQCVISAKRAKCLGSGISKMNGEFRYESDLHLDGATLQSDWTLHYSNGRSDNGNDSHQRAL